MRDTFLPYSPPVIGEAEIAEVVATLRSPWITTGPRVARFEEEFARYLGAPAALALNSCSAALHLSLITLGIGPGDGVITTPLTFAATVHAIEHVGARPILVDVEPDTLNLDPNRVADALQTFSAPPGSPTGAPSGSVKAILAVHLHGHPCDLDSLLSLAARYDLALVEDAAHALPARFQGRRVGAPPPSSPVSNLVCFSFYATKNLTTAEGGMLAGPPALLEEARLWSQQGVRRPSPLDSTADRSWNYEVLRPGFKYNMTDIQAAIGLHQLARLDGFHRRRQEIAARYRAAFSSLEELEPPAARPDTEHAWHIYALRLRLSALRISRNQFIEELRGHKIGASVHFIPIHLHPYYQDRYRYEPEDFPVAYREYQRLVSLPLNPGMSDRDVDDVIEAVSQIVRHSRRKSALKSPTHRPENNGGRGQPEELLAAGDGRFPASNAVVRLPQKGRTNGNGTPLVLAPHSPPNGTHPWKLSEAVAARLLGRPPIQLDLTAAGRQLRGQRVLVTGAGGSIGLEICRQLARFEPELLLLYERAESNLYEALLDLKQYSSPTKLVPVLGDILDAPKISRVIQTYAPQIVFHAAAFKHVPLMEHHPLEAVANNVFGVETVALAAQAGGVKKFIYISTDKAVRPTGIMGMTKGLGQRLLFSLNGGDTSFVALRLSNVLLSRGSVVCLFRQQIAQRRPLTITHLEASRYFLLLREAADLAILAVARGNNGDLLLLNPGSPVRIVDLAHNLIRSLGLEPGRDVQTSVVGLRPGEKLQEEIVGPTESLLPTEDEMIYKVGNHSSDARAFREALSDLRHHLEQGDGERAAALLRALADGH